MKLVQIVPVLLICSTLSAQYGVNELKSVSSQISVSILGSDRVTKIPTVRATLNQEFYFLRGDVHITYDSQTTSIATLGPVLRNKWITIIPQIGVWGKHLTLGGVLYSSFDDVPIILDISVAHQLSGKDQKTLMNSRNRIRFGEKIDCGVYTNLFRNVNELGPTLWYHPYRKATGTYARFGIGYLVGRHRTKMNLVGIPGVYSQRDFTRAYIEATIVL